MVAIGFVLCVFSLTCGSDLQVETGPCGFCLYALLLLVCRVCLFFSMELKLSSLSTAFHKLVLSSSAVPLAVVM